MIARRTGIASVAVLAGMVLSVGVVHAVAPDWSRRMGMDVWNITDAEADAQAAMDRGQELTVAGDRISHQIEASDRVTGELVAGRLKLPAAVAEMALINEHREGFYESLRCLHRGVADKRELLAHYTMCKVQRHFRAHHQSHEREAMSKLKTEFRKLTGKDWAGTTE